MKSLPILLAAYLIASPAFAVIDPDPDMMGIYFDLDANENCLTIGPSTPFFAYAILTNPTIPSVNAYEFSNELVIPEGVESLIFRLSDYPYWGFHPWPPNPDPLGGDYIVGLAAPYPTSPSTPLHVWQYMLLGVIPIEIYLRAPSIPSIPGDLPIVMNAEGNILMQVGLSTGGPDIPVATVNTDCVVGLEDTNFGSVKALFR